MIDIGERPRVSRARRERLRALLRSIDQHPPSDLASSIREILSIDLSTSYGGVPIPHPFGKGSGQLSCNVAQVREDAESGLAFVVLKTVIAEAASGKRSMGAWANPETRMRVEHRISRGQREGWTVSWKGRGWAGSLQDYCSFFDDALRCGAEGGLLVVPSVKYHLPGKGEAHRADEYEHTTEALERVWKRHSSSSLMLEKDLSPTLAGDARAEDRGVVLDWLSNLGSWVRATAQVRLGVKVMNAVYDDDFQLEMLETLMRDERSRPDFLVVFNRLFDRERGIAYGGWDLSDRNLRILERAHARGIRLGPLSGTGNICSGRMMVEYALRGCENGQIHTFFQVPKSEYVITGASRSRSALYTLCLDPDDGLVPWLWGLNEMGHLEPRDGVLHFRDIVGHGVR